MSLQHFSVYRLSDGTFTGQQLGLPAAATEAQVKHSLSSVPEGCGVKLGRFSHHSQRVDVTQEDHPVVEWQSPQPSPDHYWNQSRKRWEATAESLRRASVIEQIRKIEREEQPRAIREALLVGGLDRLREMDLRIAALRKKLTPPDSPAIPVPAPCRVSVPSNGELTSGGDGKLIEPQK